MLVEEDRAVRRKFDRCGSREQELCAGIAVRCVESDHWARGGEGAEDLARVVAEVADSGAADFRPIEQMRLQRFNGTSWELFGPVMEGSAGS